MFRTNTPLQIYCLIHNLGADSQLVKKQKTPQIV